MKHLVVIGDVAWDIVMRPGGELVWASDVYGEVDLLPGGAAANVAVWAHRLGARVRLVGSVGDDRLGALMRAHLESEGVAADLITVPGRSTTRIGILIRADGEHAFITDHSNPLRLSAEDLSPALLDGAGLVFLNGYAVFMAGSARFARPLLDLARRNGIPVAFDPSSFSLVARHGGTRLLDEIGPLDVLLANEEEAAALAGADPVESLTARAGLVVLKRGKNGATALTAEGPVHSAADPVRVVDTMGAGDAFDAAFLVALLEDRPVGDALAAANRLGGRVAARLGAQTEG